MTYVLVLGTLWSSPLLQAERRPSADDFPTQCQGFLQTNNTKLVGVWGSYDLEPPRWITSVTFSPDGAMALSGSATPGQNYLEGGEVKLWDVATGKEIHTFRGHTRRVKSVAFSPDEAWAVSASGDGTVRLWDIASGKEIRTLKKVDGMEYNFADAVAVSPDGRLVLVGTSEEPGLRLLDIASGRELRTFNVEFGADSIAFSPDGRFALSVSSYEPPKLWEVASGKMVREFRIKQGLWLYLLKSKGAWSSAGFSPGGQQVVAGNSDSDVRLWDATTGEERIVFHGHKGRVSSVAFCPSGRLLLSAGSEDHTIRLWDVVTGKAVDRIDLATSKDFAYAVACSPNGRSFIAGTDRGVVLHFELRAGQPSP